MADSDGPIGRPARRREAQRLAAGRGRDDLRLPRMVHAAFLRSPHPHARISTVRAASAILRAVNAALALVTEMPITPEAVLRALNGAGDSGPPPGLR